jgi:predicted double-glycine peptidase
MTSPELPHQPRLRIQASLRLAGPLAMISACALSASVSAQTTHFVLPGMPGGGFNADISTMLDRRFYSVVRQQFDFSCGSAALATLLHYHYGIPANEDTTFNGMWDNGDQEAIRRSGFSLLDMKRYLASTGLETQGFRVTLDQIAETGIPGIALTVTEGYRHFVVIKGVSPGAVLVGDPSRGLRYYTREEFTEIWDGLFFVITDARETGRASFNRAAQWAAVPPAPVGGAFGRPMEREALRIATPALVLGEL